jgi:hypothetical protein
MVATGSKLSCLLDETRVAGEPGEKSVMGLYQGTIPAFPEVEIRLGGIGAIVMTMRVEE